MKKPHEVSSVSKPKKPKKVLTCLVCAKEYRYKYDLRSHMYTHTGEKPFPCDMCDKRFVSKTKLRSYAKRHRGYKCLEDDCQFECDTWTEFRKHKSTHRTNKKCLDCSKVLRSDEALDEHMKLHDRAYKCLQCECIYSTKFNLMAHIRVDHQHKTFDCTVEGCGEKFAHKKSLDIHTERGNHTGQTKEDGEYEEDAMVKPRVIRRKKIFASELTGFELDGKEKVEMLTADKIFRMAANAVGI